jgi:hypothetical protein
MNKFLGLICIVIGLAIGIGSCTRDNTGMLLIGIVVAIVGLIVTWRAERPKWKSKVWKLGFDNTDIAKCRGDFFLKEWLTNFDKLCMFQLVINGSNI